MADLNVLIKKGEGISVEFKECRRTLNRDVYETVCAFLNRHGGTLLLGVGDAGEVTGVDPDSVEQIKKDFVTAINPETFSPFPKNPVIARFFREIGRADELGSGVRKLMKYGKAYGGSDPELVEGDIFRIIVKCPDFEARQTDPNELRPESRAQVGAQVEVQVNQRILLACVETPLSSAEIAAALGHKQLRGNLRKALPELRKAGLIEYTIPDKPNSRLQKYRLTDAGNHLLKSMQE
jgi:predicted HTH transcriptional regulator